jgi:hypothetical protein
MSRIQTPKNKILGVLATVAITFSSIGCHSSYQGYQYSHCLDSHIARKRATIQAWYVWMQCRDQCGCERLCDYRRGFIEGYCSTALGGDGCTPVVPSSRYWGWRYQNSTGAECVAAWYQGYPMGVAAATQVGGNYQIQTIVPEGPEYEEFNREFQASYNSNVAPTPVQDSMTPQTLDQDGNYESLPVAPKLESGTPEGVDLDLSTQDLIDAPVAPSLDRPGLDATSTSFDEEDLLESLDALERETLNRVSK